MKRRSGWLSALLFALVGAIAACHGPSNAGAGGRPSTGSAGNVLLAVLLPTPLRDALGYDHSSVPVGTVANGEVTALAPEPAGTATLAGHEPLHELARVTSTSSAAEANLPFAPSSIAAAGTFAFAATGDPAVAGSGDLHRRRTIGGAVTWAMVVDGAGSASTVAVETSAVAFVSGGQGLSADLFFVDAASAAIVASLSLGPIDPRAAVEYPSGSGTLYVGGADASGSGAGSLRRVRGAAAVEAVGLPAQTTGTRQEVSALLVVPTTTPGVELLVIALVERDPTTGTVLGGQIVLTDGGTQEMIHSLSGDAPLCLAFHDATLQAGTALGQLLVRDAAGAWFPEPGFPAVDRVTSLLSRDRRTLIAGCRTAGGPLVILRTGRTP